MLDHAKKLQPQLVSWRRDFHMHPELGFQERRTSARVAEALKSLGYRLRTGVGGTGIVAELGKGHPIIAIRADMDALPIQDAKTVPYASQVPNVMHACGHDAHTAIALGVATLLVQESFPGTARLLFQPAEEIADEQGLSGAPRMVKEGAIDGVDEVLALHVDPTLPTGRVSLGAGASSAGVDTFYATIIGQGGHAASPHRVVDPIHITGHIILALNSIVSRRLHPTAPAVISIGSIHAGKTDNVVPERVKMIGTIRYMESTVQKQIHAEIDRSLSISRAMGGDYELEIEIGYPPMFNDAETVDLLRQVATSILGAEFVQPTRLEMGAEDFGFFCQEAPGAMFLLGCQIEGDPRKAHGPRFDIDERCLPIGAAVLAAAALQRLREKGNN